MTDNFHYSHLKPQRPGILPLNVTETKKCSRCGGEFTTRSKSKHRCGPCQAIVNAEKQQKANERHRAKLAKRKGGK